VIFFVMILPGIAGKMIFQDLENANMIYPRLVFELLPVGLIGLVLAGFLAAMTSTLSAILNSASTLFTMDIASKVRPGLTARQKVWVGNLAGLVIMAVAAAWAPNVGKYDSIVKYFQELLSYMTPPIVTIFVLGLFWKRATAGGAFAGLVTGFLLAAFFIFFKDLSPLRHLHFLYAAPIVFGITALVVAAVSLIRPREADEQSLRFIWTRRIYRQESLELKALPWYKNYRILSLILLIITAIFFIFWS
jgi:SSS family solute:Na+ symporter